MPSLVTLSAAVGCTAILVPVLANTTLIPSVLSGLVIAFSLLAVLLLILSRSIVFLGKEEQLRLDMFTETVMINGPGVKFMNPFTYKSATKYAASMLGTVDFVKLKDSVTGAERVARGPQLLFLGPYENVTHQGKGVTLSETQYISVENQLSGESFLKKGPTIWFPESPHEIASAVSTAIALQEDEYVRLKDEATGQRYVEKGKKLLFLQTRWRLEGGVRRAWTLKSFEYVRLLNKITGKVTVHRGEKIVFPGPDEEMLDTDKMSAIDLKVDEYVKLEDQSTGEVRVVPGPAQVFLGPNERTCDGGKKKAVQVDEETAVLVRDTSTGQLRLTTERQLFVPGPHEQIQEVQQLIKLADHEAMIIKDKDGNLHFHYGSPERNTQDAPRSFFLPPYAEIVKLWWSSGLRRLKRDLCIERFDCRSQYMWFEFDCRTQDNVELVLECTIFWEVADLAKMVRTTGNLPGDVYNQARSQFIKHVAKVTLKEFMEQLHKIASSIYSEDEKFYETRGVKIHSLEVTRYKTADPRTSEVLQQIIEETTNRLNRLSQAESENEVKMFRMQGQIEQEKLNEELLEIQQRHSKGEAQAAGAAESERVAAFIQGLEMSVPKLDDRIAMWQVLRKTDALNVVAEGGGNFYYTPNDVDLSIRTDAQPRLQS